MKEDRILEAAVWVITTGLLVLFIPRHRIREGAISFLFMQVPSWLFGLIVVQCGWIQYPSRFMAAAVKSSFTYEFFVFPSMSALYNVHYPVDRTMWRRVCYMLAYPTMLTALELVLESYTNLITYVHWNGFITWVTTWITLHGSYWFYVWFKRGSLKSRLV